MLPLHHGPFLMEKTLLEHNDSPRTSLEPTAFQNLRRAMSLTLQLSQRIFDHLLNIILPHLVKHRRNLPPKLLPIIPDFLNLPMK